MSISIIFKNKYDELIDNKEYRTKMNILVEKSICKLIDKSISCLSKHINCETAINVESYDSFFMKTYVSSVNQVTIFEQICKQFDIWLQDNCLKRYYNYGNVVIFWDPCDPELYIEECKKNTMGYKLGVALYNIKKKEIAKTREYNQTIINQLKTELDVLYNYLITNAEKFVKQNNVKINISDIVPVLETVRKNRDYSIDNVVYGEKHLRYVLYDMMKEWATKNGAIYYYGLEKYSRYNMEYIMEWTF